MSSLLKRILTGIIYVGLIIVTILFTNWAFAVLCALFGALGLVEYDKLARKIGSLSGTAFGCDMTFGIIALLTGAVASATASVAMAAAAVVLIYIIVRLSLQLYIQSENPITDVAKSMLSLCWVIVPLACLETLFSISRGAVLVLFIMIWLNDTGAYCAGSLLGRHKLFERISPKKTWEGWIGGFLFTVIFGWFAPVIEQLGFELLTQWQSMILGVVVSVAATYGDLAESLFKRALNAKDSGNILPGHGGILDRIDSLLFAAPATLLLILLL